MKGDDIYVCQTCGTKHSGPFYLSNRTGKVETAGHRDGLGLFCSVTCALTFAVVAHQRGVRLKKPLKVKIRELRDPLLALALSES